MSQSLRLLSLPLVVIFLMLTNLAKAQDAPLPFVGTDIHLGVSSCGGSSCHGALEPWPNSTVAQNEFTIWQENDAHSTAYATLLTEKSKRIAENLGLPNAYEAPICLNCHADNVATDRRAKGFEISDGVGCEACHGGAVQWLGIHVSGASDHAANLNAGLYPTENPTARAKLCLSCHFGDKDRFITHRIMGAGHPRLSIELDTFTAIQPAHFIDDADYRARKGVISHIKVWAAGQVIATGHLLDALLDPDRNKDGIFPELVFFDCHACHHPMSNVRWEPREDVSIGPGVPRLADANLIMFGVLLDQMAPEAADDYRARVKALHQASLRGHEATLAAAEHLRALTRTFTTRVEDMQFGEQEVYGLLSGLISHGRRGAYVDYAAAEQAIMAISAIVDAMKDSELVSAEQYDVLIAEIDKCYDALEKDEAYEPKKFLAGLLDINDVISSW